MLLFRPTGLRELELVAALPPLVVFLRLSAVGGAAGERAFFPTAVTDARTPPKGALELGAKSCGLRPRTAARAL